MELKPGRYEVDQNTGELKYINPNPDLFKGVNGSIASVSGLVPPSPTGGENKFFRGDGEWADLPIFQGVSGSIQSVGGMLPPAQAGDENKAFFGDGTFKKIETMPIDEDLDPTSNHPVENQAIAKNIEAIVNTYGSKNLLPNRATSQVLNGITFTVNSDGSITANGTSSAQCILGFATVNLEGGREYIYTDETNPSNTTYFMNYQVSGQPSTNINLVDLPYSFTVTEDTSYSFNLYVRSGQTLNNVVFKPMIRDARITDDTYFPYAMTNRELTETIGQFVNTGLYHVTKTTDAGTSISINLSTTEKHSIFIYGAFNNDAGMMSIVVKGNYTHCIHISASGIASVTVTRSNNVLTIPVSSYGIYECYSQYKIS